MDKPYETETKGGKKEERIYVDSGKFVIYSYKDESTGKMIKSKLILIGNKNNAYFLIPMKDKSLAINAQFNLESEVNMDGKSIKLNEILKNIK